MGGVYVHGCMCVHTSPTSSTRTVGSSSWVHIYFCDLGCVMDPPEKKENFEAFSSSRRYDLGDLSSSPTQTVSSKAA